MAVGFFEVIGVEEGDILDACLFFYFIYVFLVVCCGVAGCGCDDYDLCFVFSAGELGEFIPYGGGGADVAADDEEGAFFGAVEGSGFFYFDGGIDEGFGLGWFGLGCGRCGGWGGACRGGCGSGAGGCGWCRGFGQVNDLLFGEWFSVLEVITLAFAEHYERSGRDAIIIIDQHIGLAYDLKCIFLYDYSCCLIEANADEFGGCSYKIDHVELSVSCEQVLVDNGVLQEGEALGMVTDEDIVAPGITAPEEGTLNSRSGGASDDDASAVEDIEEGLMCEGIEIGICDAPLAAAIEEDACGCL